MKRIFKLFMAIAIFFVACEDEKGPFLDGVTSNPTITSTFPGGIVINEDNIESGVLTINFTPAIYDIDLGVMSQLQIAPAGTNFSSAVSLGTAVDGKDTRTVTVAHRALNTILRNFELEPNEAANMQIRVRSFAKADLNGNIGEVMPVYSAPLTVAMTPFVPLLPDPTWIYAVGAFNGWNHGVAEQLWSLLDNDIYIGYINFPIGGNGEFKLTPVPSWSEGDWGSPDGATLVGLTGSRPNIVAPGEGYHRITADLNDMTIEMVPYVWGIIGSATPTGWSNCTKMTWSFARQRWEITIDLIGGQHFKVRWNSAWDVDYGITNGDVTQGGGNIPVSETGTYLVTFDRANLVIEWTLQ